MSKTFPGLQEGLKLTEEQQEQVLEMRDRVILWLGKACSLRAESYSAICHALPWQHQVNIKNATFYNKSICMTWSLTNLSGERLLPLPENLLECWMGDLLIANNSRQGHSARVYILQHAQ